jgi:hypothetical protein
MVTKFFSFLSQETFFLALPKRSVLMISGGEPTASLGFTMELSIKDADGLYD